jgi:putative transposase
VGLPPDRRRAPRARSRGLGELGACDPDPPRAASGARTRRRQLATVPASAGGNDAGCDFLTVENIWLTRIYVLFFVSLERRRIEFIASTSNPDGRWTAQQARNLLMQLADRGQSFRFQLHDRDSKFSGGFNEIFASEGVAIVRTPIRAPNANAYAERWIGTLPRECLDRILIINRRQLEQVLRVYTAHYNRHRPHRSLSLQPPDEPTSAPGCAPIRHIERHELLGGLINEYKAAA